MFRRIFLFFGIVLSCLAAIVSIPFYSALILRQGLEAPSNYAPALFAAAPNVLRSVTSSNIQPDYASSSASDRSEIAKLANLTLRIEPTSPSALRALGQLSVADGNRFRARQLILAGDALSHRDRQANLWLIDDSVQRGNLEQGLYYFDQLLRTLGDDRGSMIALFTQLLADERAVEPMEKILKRQPNWSEQFWLFIPGNTAVLENAAKLRVRLDDSMSAEDRKSDSILIAALADAGHYSAGFAVAKTVFPSLSPSGVNNANFSSSADVAPYNWQATGTNAFAVNVSERTNTLEISSSPGSSGDIIRQLVRLDPGGYRPVVTLSEDYQNQSLPELSVSLECAGTDDRQSALILSYSERNAPQSPLTATADCTWFWVVLSSGYSMSAYDVSIERIDLVR